MSNGELYSSVRCCQLHILEKTPDVVDKLTLMSFDLRKNTLQQLQGLSVVLCLHFYQLHRQSETQQRVRTVCTSMYEFTHVIQAHLLSGSSLHSRFLWPQNCTCLLTVDPSEGSKKNPEVFIKNVQTSTFF